MKTPQKIAEYARDIVEGRRMGNVTRAGEILALALAELPPVIEGFQTQVIVKTKTEISCDFIDSGSRLYMKLAMVLNDRKILTVAAGLVATNVHVQRARMMAHAATLCAHQSGWAKCVNAERLEAKKRQSRYWIMIYGSKPFHHQVLAHRGSRCLS